MRHLQIARRMIAAAFDPIRGTVWSLTTPKPATGADQTGTLLFLKLVKPSASAQPVWQLWESPPFPTRSGYTPSAMPAQSGVTRRAERHIGRDVERNDLWAAEYWTGKAVLKSGSGSTAKYLVTTTVECRVVTVKDGAIADQETTGTIVFENEANAAYKNGQYVAPDPLIAFMLKSATGDKAMSQAVIGDTILRASLALFGRNQNSGLRFKVTSASTAMANVDGIIWTLTASVTSGATEEYVSVSGKAASEASPTNTKLYSLDGAILEKLGRVLDQGERDREQPGPYY